MRVNVQKRGVSKHANIPQTQEFSGLPRLGETRQTAAPASVLRNLLRHWQPAEWVDGDSVQLLNMPLHPFSTTRGGLRPLRRCRSKQTALFGQRSDRKRLFVTLAPTGPAPVDIERRRRRMGRCLA